MSSIKGHEALGNTSRLERKGPREYAKHSCLKITLFRSIGLT